MSTRKKILVLGASGMLGNAMLRFLSDSPDLEVTGTLRSSGALGLFSEKLRDSMIVGLDALQPDQLVEVLGIARPDVVINCVGIVKQLRGAREPLVAIPVNSVLPHRLDALCALASARLIHVSTDCVFSGRKGDYVETDTPDAEDLYGRSKLLGEVSSPNSITLRTSIIGHELTGHHSLVDWFLSEPGPVKGYRKAIFSGVPTCELARIVRDHVLPDPGLNGLYHVSADPIDKDSLLRLVAAQYGKSTEVIGDDALVIDRSLNSARFRSATGYRPPAWDELVSRMHQFQ